jgi:hypothetical protein
MPKRKQQFFLPLSLPPPLLLLKHCYSVPPLAVRVVGFRVCGRTPLPPR